MQFFQYLVAPEWDKMWLDQNKIAQYGSASPSETFVFGVRWHPLARFQ